MTSRTIDIQSGDGQSFKGYLALPPTGTGPGIVLIQEIFGVNSHIRAVADQYALDGYVVLAPDMFWRQEPGLDIGYTPADMQKGISLMQKLDAAQAVKDLTSTVNTLRALPECTGKVASIGYCMGGRLSFLSAANAGVDAAVCYYPGGIEGQLSQAGKVKCPVMFHFAGNDGHISPEAVAAVKSTFEGKKDVVVEVYPGVDHGFNCWARGAYNQKAAALAHGRSLSFIATALG
ncbi:MAG: carboxymethylenebutenolidase [Burkholderiales bacterium]